MRWTRSFFPLWLSLVPMAASAEFPDWATLSEVEVIDVVTADADGDARTTPVWFVLVDGEAYLRTSDSRWLENLRREPAHRLVIDEREYSARAEEVAGDAIIARVDAASLAKYGWQERVIHAFRMSPPDILKLAPLP